MEFSDNIRVPREESAALCHEATERLGLLAERVQSFFQSSTTAPSPQCIEDPCTSSQGLSHIEMNLVLGVLEPRQPPASDILIPTPQVLQKLDDDQEQEARAFLELMRSLRPTAPDDSSSSSGSVDYDASSGGETSDDTH